MNEHLLDSLELNKLCVYRFDIQRRMKLALYMSKDLNSELEYSMTNYLFNIYICLADTRMLKEILEHKKRLQIALQFTLVSLLSSSQSCKELREER